MTHIAPSHSPLPLPLLLTRPSRQNTSSVLASELTHSPRTNEPWDGIRTQHKSGSKPPPALFLRPSLPPAVRSPRHHPLFFTPHFSLNNNDSGVWSLSFIAACRHLFLGTLSMAEKLHTRCGGRGRGHAGVPTCPHITFRRAVSKRSSARLVSNGRRLAPRMIGYSGLYFRFVWVTWLFAYLPIGLFDSTSTSCDDVRTETKPSRICVAFDSLVPGANR